MRAYGPLLALLLVGCAGDDKACVAAAEIPEDGIDQDCSGADLLYWDDDLDGYTSDVDCNDADPGAYPGAPEACNGQDDDCDGVVDEDAPTTTWYRDEDGDGWGTDADTVEECDGPAGYVSGSGDCDDANAAVSPGAAESCDGLDDDCNGRIPGSEDDDDADGYFSCSGDCDETDSRAHPGAPETCDGLDDDCDGVMLDGEVDADGDGSLECEPDCDEADPDTWPGAPELCDGVDNDCDGVVPTDELDQDGDGRTTCAGDCDDADPLRAGGNLEVCRDNIDDDCDGVVDNADCLRCDGIVPSTWPTIQGAIELAGEGALVCVSPGRYLENVDFEGVGLTVVGIGGTAGTIIDGGAVDTVVRFESAETDVTVLSRFTVTNGLGSTGGGVRIVGASPVLEDVEITGNSATDAGGLYVEDGAPSLTGVGIRDNHADIYVVDGDTEGEGGGAWLTGDQTVLDNVVIDGNAAGWDGGGLYLYDSAAAFTNVRVTGNSTHTYYGGGIYMSASSPSLTNAVISTNSTGVSFFGDLAVGGGGIYMIASDPTLDNVLVAYNTTADGPGGGIWAGTGSDARLRNVLITGNLATNGAGGGLYSGSNLARVTYTDVSENVPDNVRGVTFTLGVDGNLGDAPDLLDGVGHLSSSSALIDAGDPALLDPDGSTSDIGSFGGPGAALWDIDRDGGTSWWLPGTYDAATSPGADCDDDDALVYAGAGC